MLAKIKNGNDIAVDLFMRSHPLPSRGGVRGGVCNISNILSAKSVGEEVSAKSGLQRSGSEGVAAKNITDITDPTPAPPLEGRGWLRIELCGGQGDSYCTK